MKEVEYQKHVKLIKRESLTERLTEKAFIKVTEESMVSVSILHTNAYAIISSNWEKIKNKYPEYTFAICIKQEWKTNMLKRDPSRYKKDSKMFEKCYKGEHYWLERIIEPEIFNNRFEGKEEYYAKSVMNT